ncbi:uncharacterized protein LOC114531295, partial [Dendronephthya gigantea]|uniref:uncharacterized protein LOC114531295 n=1 Tax=Dendronephthya gigantea TaxID=151771 RepID=UPI0010698998
MENLHNGDENRGDYHTSERQEAGESSTSTAVPPQSRDIGEALETIGENMGQMATMLQQIYEERRSSKSPTGRKRARSQSPPANSSTKSKSALGSTGSTTRQTHEGSSRQIDDDRVSIYASGSEQDDLEEDLLLLTGQNKSVNDQPDSDLLRDLANALEEDEPTGESVNQPLADIANKRWGKQLGSDKVKALLTKYKRPENCRDITEVRVNPEIWGQLSSQKKKTDLQLSNFQQIARKLLFANLQMTNTLLAGQQIDSKSVLAQSVDSIALLGHMNHNLSQLRRDQIRPALKPEYVSICSSSADHEDSKLLFGDDLPKRLRDAKESCRIGNTMTHNITRQSGRKQISRESNASGQRASGHPYRRPGKDFSGKARLGLP